MGNARFTSRILSRKVPFLLLLFFTSRSVAGDWVDYVNPLAGTQSVHAFSTGNTYPVIASPWGMNFWTPQTGKMGDGWIYTYTETKSGDSNRRTSLLHG